MSPMTRSDARKRNAKKETPMMTCLFSHCIITGCPCEHPDPREEE